MNTAYLVACVLLIRDLKLAIIDVYYSKLIILPIFYFIICTVHTYKNMKELKQLVLTNCLIHRCLAGTAKAMCMEFGQYSVVTLYKKCSKQ